MAITHPVGRQQPPASAPGDLAHRKLEAFGRIEKEFLTSFRFIEEVHGQRRFTAFPVANTVRYLHALYICECKDRLLSVPHTLQRYDGARCLELLRDWQEGHTAGVVAFIHHRLDEQPFGELSHQIEDAIQAKNAALAQRLISGRAVLLNRLFTLAYAIDTIFALEPKQLRSEARAACKRYGHTPDQIDAQLAELRLDLSAYAPHPALARHNMIVMNSAGLRNVLNYFNGDGQGGGFPTSRGATTPLEFERQRTKIITALVGLDADVVGLMEIENDGDGSLSAVQDLVNGLNAATAPDTYAFVAEPAPGTDDIKVTLIYRSGRVTPIGAAQNYQTDTAAYTPLYDRPPLVQRFQAPHGQQFFVIVNHFKSKSDCPSSGVDVDLGQGCWNAKRTAQANELLNLSGTLQPIVPDVIVVGDLNAYAGRRSDRGVENRRLDRSSCGARTGPRSVFLRPRRPGRLSRPCLDHSRPRCAYHRCAALAHQCG